MVKDFSGTFSLHHVEWSRNLCKVVNEAMTNIAQPKERAYFSFVLLVKAIFFNELTAQESISTRPDLTMWPGYVTVVGKSLNILSFSETCALCRIRKISVTCGRCSFTE